MTPHLVGTLCGIGVIANNGGWALLGNGLRNAGAAEKRMAQNGWLVYTSAKLEGTTHIDLVSS